MDPIRCEHIVAACFPELFVILVVDLEFPLLLIDIDPLGGLDLNGCPVFLERVTPAASLEYQIYHSAALRSTSIP